MNMLQANALPQAGFAQPVDEAQAVFRQTLDALAQPGRVHTLTGSHDVPPGVGLAMTALLLTLADADTPVWLPAGVDASLRAYLRFHCGCPLVEAPQRAVFVAVPAGCAAPRLGQLAQGEAAYPDRSATLLLEVTGLRGIPSPPTPLPPAGEGSQQAGQGVRLTGPGISAERRLDVAGLPADFWTQWQDNTRHFPLGVDAFLTQDARLCGLARTTHVEC